MPLVIVNEINKAVANSFVGRRFRLEGSGHVRSRRNSRFLTEIRAGLATFFVSRPIIYFDSLRMFC